ncbi:MAG: glycosyltransferase family 9 protein [Acidobacteria bacterium]|nr:glycosyltransferase family 9 protein [Acidobacteriota bacterium]
MSAIDWPQIRRILVVKLRSIGDTVLSTPSLIALRRHAPQAEIDILLEDWVAPVLDGFEGVNVISMGSSTMDRLAAARQLRRRGYDVAFNLHGGTTSTFLAWASGARHRFGNADYQYSFLYNHKLSSPVDFWGREKLHSAEQQLALIGHAGVPVDDLPKTKLEVVDAALASIETRLSEYATDPRSSLALIHPSTAFTATKQWPAEKFACVAEALANKGLSVIAISSKQESQVLDALKNAAGVPITAFDDLSLPEISALASKARIFIGNDSGIAHIAAAVQTPTVVIFGSSNRTHWRPWTDAPNQIVFNPFDCQPCPGYKCEVYGDSRCIHSVTVEQVTAAAERVLG